jgi:hypothetical protein
LRFSDGGSLSFRSAIRRRSESRNPKATGAITLPNRLLVVFSCEMYASAWRIWIYESCMWLLMIHEAKMNHDHARGALSPDIVQGGLASAGHSPNPPPARFSHCHRSGCHWRDARIALRLDAVCPVEGVKHVAWSIQTLQVMSRAAGFSAMIGAFQPLLLGFSRSAPHFSITNSSPGAGTAVLRGQGAREPCAYLRSPRSSFRQSILQ